MLTVPTPVRGVADRTQQKKMQSMFVVFTAMFASVASIAVLSYLQFLQNQFLLTNQSGLQKNFQDLVSDGKGEGDFFFNYAGPDRW